MDDELGFDDGEVRVTDPGVAMPHPNDLYDDVELSSDGALSRLSELYAYALGSEPPRGEFGEPQRGVDEKGDEREGPRGFQPDTDVEQHHAEGLLRDEEWVIDHYASTWNLPTEFLKIVPDQEKIRAHIALHGNQNPIPGIVVRKRRRTRIVYPTPKEGGPCE